MQGVEKHFLKTFLYTSPTKTFFQRKSKLEKKKTWLSTSTRVVEIIIGSTTIYTGLNIPINCLGKK